MSNLMRLTLNQIGNVDSGRAMEAFQNCMRRAVLDCNDRPGLKTKRKVVMEMVIWPVPHIEGNVIDCESVAATVKVKAMIPHYETQELDFGIRNNGELVFNPDSPTNHRQETFDEVSELGRGARDS